MRTRSSAPRASARVRGLSLLVLLVLLVAGGQTAAGATVGLLLPKNVDFGKDVSTEFAALLKAAGLPAGETTVLLQVPIDEKISRVQSIQKLFAQEVDILVVHGGAAAREASDENGKMPIVAMGVSNPVKDGLAVNLEEPGKSVTGVQVKLPLQLLIQAINDTTPIRELGVLYQSENKESMHDLSNIRDLAAKLKYSLVEVDLRKTKETELAAGLKMSNFVILTAGAAVPGGTLLKTLDGRFPIASRSPGFHEDGVVFTQTPDLKEILAIAARMTAGIVSQKTPPGNVSFNLVDKSAFGIDLREAKKFSFQIPFSVLKDATTVVK